MDAQIVFDYFKESQGYDSVHTPHGFIMYRIADTECHIGHMYVRPYARKLGKAQELARMVEIDAKEKGCTHLSCVVDLLFSEKDRLIKGYTLNGFKETDSSENPRFIILKKDLP